MSEEDEVLKEILESEPELRSNPNLMPSVITIWLKHKDPELYYQVVVEAMRKRISVEELFLKALRDYVLDIKGVREKMIPPEEKMMQELSKTITETIVRAVSMSMMNALSKMSTSNQQQLINQIAKQTIGQTEQNKESGEVDEDREEILE